jgi:hypothetical protein
MNNLAGALTPINNPLFGQSLQDMVVNDPFGFFQKLIPNLIGLAFIVGVLIFFFVFVSAAIQWISSGGEKASIEAARGKLMNAVIGLVLLLLVFMIIKLIEAFFGIDILKINIGVLKIE